MSADRGVTNGMKDGTSSGRPQQDDGHLSAVPAGGARTVRRPRRANRSITIDFDDGFGQALRGFLRQIVPDAALDNAVRIFARELLCIGTWVRMRRTVGITFEVIVGTI